MIAGDSFSELLEINREILKEGMSLIITIYKNSLDANRFKKLTVKKISSLNSLINKPISSIEIYLNDKKNLDNIKEILVKPGDTEVKIKVNDEGMEYVFKLKNKRHVDKSHLNLLKNQGISANIL